MDFAKRIISPDKNQILSQDGYLFWCGSAVGDGNGKYHIFASRWEKKHGMIGWLHFSKIVRGVSDKPEGPYKIEEELTSLLQPWCAKMTHNPTVHKFGNKYYLYYLGTTYDDNTDIPKMHGMLAECPARFNQRIGVAVADGPEGPWVPNANNPVLKPRPGEWDSTFVTNPSVFEGPNKKYHLIYKAKWHTDSRLILGLAISDSPVEGFKRFGPSPIFAHDVEDPYVWNENGRYWMLAKDMSGKVTNKMEGILFVSENGADWELSGTPFAYDRTIQWSDGTSETVKNLERPQLLVENGKPVCFYAAIMRDANDITNLARLIN